VIRQNLLWVFAYNAVAVAAAAAGLLTPLIATLAMIGSSAVVVASARRLRRPERASLGRGPQALPPPRRPSREEAAPDAEALAGHHLSAPHRAAGASPADAAARLAAAAAPAVERRLDSRQR
jgi:hypothetical protein